MAELKIMIRSHIYDPHTERCIRCHVPRWGTIDFDVVCRRAITDETEWFAFLDRIFNLNDGETS